MILKYFINIIEIFYVQVSNLEFCFIGQRMINNKCRSLVDCFMFIGCDLIPTEIQTDDNFFLGILL